MEFEPDIPRWRQVAAVIRSRIEDGTYAPRTRVPSVIQIIAEFGVASATAQKVNQNLKKEGLIYTEPGLGSFVSPNAAAALKNARAESEDTG
ncbi:winged helix-turn-helix domain-containing protein [Streptomyces sp. NPDC052012]|uniref:GntR family transcriptional regulator n=1 Tax=Streptomyces sp. NPDC052012 TaxID=3155051 RepID=UPI00345085E9